MSEEPLQCAQVIGNKTEGAMILFLRALGCAYPPPSTLNPQPSTLNSEPSTLNFQPSTLNPQPSTLNPLP